MIGKDGYYEITEIDSTDAEYRLILGERSNGKSYAVKKACLKDSWEGKGQFVYLRRWQLDIKTDRVEAYFSDMVKELKKMTKNKCNAITVYRSIIYFSHINKDTGEVERIKPAGRSMYLSGSGHYKSMSLPDFDHVIFEEVLSEDGYLPEEFVKFESIVSTIARRRKIKVWMIGNTITRLCPYFRQWNLKGVLRQKPDTIEIYKHNNENGTVTVIAVEMTGHSPHKSSMFFTASSGMISAGEWQSDEQPKLKGDYKKDYEVKYSLLWLVYGETYRLDVLEKKSTMECVLFVYPYTGDINRIKRHITKEFDLDPLHTPKLRDDIYGDVFVKKLLSLGKICFSDNLTGTEFKTLLKEGGV